MKKIFICRLCDKSIPIIYHDENNYPCNVTSFNGTTIENVMYIKIKKLFPEKVKMCGKGRMISLKML